MHLWAYGFLGFADDFFAKFPADVHSFIHSDDKLFLMPARFCQDSLENMFGLIRQGGGTANNPSVLQAAKGSQVAQQRKDMKLTSGGGSSSYRMRGKKSTALFRHEL